MITFGTGQGFLKAGFLGFNKSGKTHTAMLLAVTLWKKLKLKNSIALFDTEASGEYIAARIKKETGKDLVGLKSRAFSELLELGKSLEADQGILIVDSITHVWREVCQAYQDQVNGARAAMNKPKRSRLEFQDWAAIKNKWAQWPDFYLNSRLHIIVCGRAGYDWDFEESENADGTTRKELVKTGVKMKVEGEFGFEPSLLVEMERLQIPDERRPGHFALSHRATVIGDRFDAMDGAMMDQPTGEWFLPHLNLLTPGASNTVETASKTDMGVDESGEAVAQRERIRRKKLLEEIENEIVKLYPGQTAKEKKAKVLLLESAFQTNSWTAVSITSLESLARGLQIIREAALTAANSTQERSE